MSTTIKVYPGANSYKYYRNTSLLSDGSGIWAYAGLTSYTYLYFLDFDLSAYANKYVKSLTFHAKRDDSESNTYGKTIGVGISTASTYAGIFGHSDLNNNQISPSGDTFMSWDIMGGWDTLKLGTAYAVIWSSQASSYTAFMTVLQSSESNRPYIEIEYEDAYVFSGADNAWVPCEVRYGMGGDWVLCKPYCGSGGVWNEIGV